jgi:hypothetical protein
MVDFANQHLVGDGADIMEMFEFIDTVVVQFGVGSHDKGAGFHAYVGRDHHTGLQLIQLAFRCRFACQFMLLATLISVNNSTTVAITDTL